MKEICRKQLNYILKEDEKGQMIFYVQAGSVVVYFQKIVLSNIERKYFETSGEKYLDELADDIRNNLDKYKDRLLLD